MKRVRLARNLTQKQLGVATGYSEGYVSKVEAGKKFPSEAFAEGCDRAFGTGGLFAEALRRLLYGERVPDWFAPYVGLEASADRILDFSPVFPMGMLQSEDYARAVFQAGPMAARGEDTAPAIAARMERRALLDGDEAPRLWAVVTESCLRTPVGGAAVMSSQLDHLLTMADHPRVTVQVLPSGMAYPCSTPFTMLRCEGTWTVYTEYPYGGRTSDDQAFVSECMDIYDLIRARALAPEDSVARISDIKSEVYT